MKRFISVLLVTFAFFAGSDQASAQPEPTVYVVKKGDTLWGLSARFIKEPGYWPDLWAHNPVVTNPHFIFPGQRVKVYADRLEIEPPAPAKNGPAEQAPPVPAVPAVTPVADEVVPERLFTVRTGTALLVGKEVAPAGHIIATYHNRHMVGEDDVVYTDIGKKHGARVGDRFSIFKNGGVVSHPKTSAIMGYKSIPVGGLELVEVEDKSSKAVITKSFMEMGVGATLMPYRATARQVALKASSREASGFIIDTQTGDQIVAAGDIVFIDLGALHGVEVGNMLYICREVEIDNQFRGKFTKAPQEVLGALVIVERDQATATALIVKSVDTIYVGDQVELKKSK